MAVYGFDTSDEHAAVGALCVYAVWRSRDRARHKITPDVWSQNERFVKAAAKRAENLPQFLERLKPRMSCGAIHPAAIAVGVKGAVPEVVLSTGEVIELAEEPGREFGVGVIERADHRAVLDVLYRETAWVIALTRDRLERERPIERRLETALDVIGETEVLES
ncbi:MAG: hypothetical protein AB7R89_16100 [Dehalococcoidia bacterium]